MRRSLGYGLLILLLSGCQNRNQPQTSEPAAASAAAQPSSGPPAEFKMEGDIVKVDKENRTATIKHGPIEGYMSAMTMSYPVPDQADLDKIKPGDHITATVYDDKAQSKYWVGNINVGEPAPK
jgi:Cu/Ag efflux protein CusF